MPILDFLLTSQRTGDATEAAGAAAVVPARVGPLGEEEEGPLALAPHLRLPLHAADIVKRVQQQGRRKERPRRAAVTEKIGENKH